MKQIGIVESADGNMLTVRIRRASACGENCASCSGGCTPTEQVVSARNTAGAQVGDKVVLQMENRYVLLAAFLVYILPLVMLFLVYAVLFAFTKSEGISGICGVLAMPVTFFLVRWFDKKVKDKYELIAVNVL